MIRMLKNRESSKIRIRFIKPGLWLFASDVIEVPPAR
jgi:hypothetical protein